jgi:hypothetical protein
MPTEKMTLSGATIHTARVKRVLKSSLLPTSGLSLAAVMEPL